LIGYALSTCRSEPGDGDFLASAPGLGFAAGGAALLTAAGLIGLGLSICISTSGDSLTDDATEAALEESSKGQRIYLILS